MDRPEKRTAPSVISAFSAGKKPEIARKVLVLPAPFRPTSATMAPSATVSDTPCMARTTSP